MLSPPSSTLELEESLQQLGASKKQINAWQQNLNTRTNTKPMPVAKHNWQALICFFDAPSCCRDSSSSRVEDGGESMRLTAWLSFFPDFP